MSTQQPGYAFVAGLATAIGAAISMAFSEGLSDTGTVTERGNAWKRGGVVGGGTFLGGILHTVPFLIPYYPPALAVALAVVVVELFALAWLRHRFPGVSSAITVLSSLDPLPPFPMWSAFPTSEYYDGSAPLTAFGRRRTYPAEPARLAAPRMERAMSGSHVH